MLRSVPRWRRGLAGASMVLALALGSGAALLLGAAASVPPWSIQPLPFAPSHHVMAWSLVGNPGTPQELTVATSEGVWTSSDDGQSWVQSSLHQFTWALAYDAAGQVLYAGTSHDGVFRSNDAGQTWKQVNTGLRSLDVRAISTGPTAIVLGTQKGVYVSGDGLAWERAGLSNLSISSVAIISDTPLGVLAGSDQVAQQNNLYRSLSVGTTGGWQAVAAGDPGGAPVFSVAAGPVVKGGSEPPLLVGNLKGLYSSADGGDTWQALNLASGALWSVNAIAFDPNNPAVIYVGGDNGGSTGGGLQESTNGGANWVPFGHGLSGAGVTGLAALSTNPLTVLASVWNPLSRVGAVARALATGAPGPVPLRSSSGTPISVAVSPTAVPTPTPHRHHRKKSSGPPIPLPVLVLAIVVVIVLVVLFTIYRRRRRQRLYAEAPP